MKSEQWESKLDYLRGVLADYESRAAGSAGAWDVEKANESVKAESAKSCKEMGYE